MESFLPQQAETDVRNQIDVSASRSCLACQKRKVKCNKGRPCLNCTNIGTACIYPPNAKRRTRGPGRKNLESAKNQEEMKKRVARLESMLENLSEYAQISDLHHLKGGNDPAEHAESGHTEVHNESNGMNNTTTEGPDRQSGSRGTRMAVEGFNPNEVAWVLERDGKSLYIENAFWASLSNEVEDLHEMLDDEPEQASPGITSSDPGAYSFMFDVRHDPRSLQALRPPASHIQRYWRTFLQNVDPLFHVIHKLEMEETTQKAVNHPDSLDMCEVALMFVIYLSALDSMSEDEVENEFGETRSLLFNRYRYASEHALTQAEHLDTKDLRMLQALVLYIICLRSYDSARHIWMLVGFAIRLALALGLHRDGQRFGISPYQTEMRRRLWWQIYTLEIRAAEDQGCDSTLNQESFDTRIPLNLNDEDLNRHASNLPMPRVGFTDMTIGLMRYEVAFLSHKVLSSKLSTKEKLHMIAACEERQRTDYLQYASGQEQRAIAAGVLARAAIAKLKLMVHNPVSPGGANKESISKPSNYAHLDQESREGLICLSISVLEDSVFCLTDPLAKKWAWVSRKYIHWYPLIVILIELCHRPLSNISERAWTAVHGVLRDGNIRANATVCNGRDAVLWRLITKLLVKAKQSGRVDVNNMMDTSAIQQPRGDMTAYRVKETDRSRTASDDYNIGHSLLPDQESASIPLSVDTTTLKIEGCDDLNMHLRRDFTNFGSPATIPLDESQSAWDAFIQDFQSELEAEQKHHLQADFLESIGDCW